MKGPPSPPASRCLGDRNLNSYREKEKLVRGSGQVDEARRRESESVERTTRREKPWKRRKKNDEEQGVGGDGEV